SSEKVIEAPERIPEEKLNQVEEITLDMSESMRKIVRRCFSKTRRVIDRFHVQQLAHDALQQMRIEHRWDAINAETEQMEEAKHSGRKYEPVIYENGDTGKQLPARSRYLLLFMPEHRELQVSRKKRGIHTASIRGTGRPKEEDRQNTTKFSICTQTNKISPRKIIGKNYSIMMRIQKRFNPISEIHKLFIFYFFIKKMSYLYTKIYKDIYNMLISVEVKHSSDFELINMQMLVNCRCLLERARRLLVLRFIYLLIYNASCIFQLFFYNNFHVSFPKETGSIFYVFRCRIRQFIHLCKSNNTSKHFFITNFIYIL
ncbi:MAG: transposase, partial [Tannerella sp.]|nr:transposase [Tannerella sp.]